MEMKKVLIIGICGAGKSTFARELSEKTKLPVIHLDKHYWKQGWRESTTEDWELKVSQISDSSEWIIDGNYSSTFYLRFPKADTIFILDYNPLLAMFRATKRIFKYYKGTRPDMATGCPERLNWEFYKFIWNFNKVHRPRTESSLRNLASDKNIIRFSNPTELKKYLQSLK